MKNHIEQEQQKRELSPEEHKVAMSLETISSLEKKDKVFIVLVWKGLKTATAVSFEPGAPESEMSDLEKRVQKAGLLFKKTDHIITEEMYMVKQEARGLRPGRVCFVANNQKDLDLISELWFGDHDNDPKVYKEMGRMSGFPQTAIDLYDKFTRLPDPEKEEVKKEIALSEREKSELFQTEPDLIPLAFTFYMSKVKEGKRVSFLESELETVRKWTKKIESVTPALYREFTDFFYRSAEFKKEYYERRN